MSTPNPMLDALNLASQDDANSINSSIKNIIAEAKQYRAFLDNDNSIDTYPNRLSALTLAIRLCGTKSRIDNAVAIAETIMKEYFEK